MLKAKPGSIGNFVQITKQYLSEILTVPMSIVVQGSAWPASSARRGVADVLQPPGCDKASLHAALELCSLPFPSLHSKFPCHKEAHPLMP